MDKHFTIGDLLKYTWPSMAMMLVMSCYDIVDGFFISNYVGTTAFAGVNFIMPVVMIMSTIGYMMGSGGSALIAKIRGEGDDERANRTFSLIVYTTFGIGLLMSAIGVFIMEPIAAALGAEGELLEIAILYGQMSMVSMTGFILQGMFQEVFSAAGKPRYAFRITAAAGCMNIFLDWLFVGVFGWGVMGAVVATNIAETIGGFVPVIYFARKNNSSYFRLCSPKDSEGRIEWRQFGKACVNGSSEMISNIAISLVSVLYNYQLLRYLGEDGVAAYGVIMYVALLFAGLMFGYVVGASPLLSYQYGAQNRVEMRSLFRKGGAIMVSFGIAMFVVAQISAPIVTGIFTGYDPNLHELSIHAFRTYSIAFLLMGISIYASAVFTALNNGLVSALLSFLRTLGFEVAAVVFLPMLMGADGVWYSVTVAEVASVAMCLICFGIFYRKYFS